MSFSDLPALNACLNGITTVFLVSGFILIRRKKIPAHKFCMSAAFLCSVLFLVSYITYHLEAGTTRFQGQGWIRPVYFSILISHTILAVCVPPLAIVTLYRAWKTQFDRHVPIARITFPIWLYVSITGVLIYRLLYH